MLYILLFLLIALVVVNYSIIKDVLSPSLLLTAIFLISTVFAILGNMNWGVQIRGFSAIIIFVGLVLIYLGELIVRNFASKRKLIDFTKCEYNAKDNKKINYSSKIIWIISAIALILTVIYYFKLLDLAKRYGYVQGEGDLLLSARVAMLVYGDGVGLICAIFGFIVRGIGFTSLCIFCNNVFVSDSIKTGIKENYVLIFPIILLLAINVLSTSRNGFILIVVITFFIIIDRIRSVKNINLVKIGAIGVGCVGAFLVVFLLIGQARGGISNILESLSIYAGSSIITLDMWLADNMFVINPNIGSETFVGLHQLIERFDPGHEAGSLFSEFVTFANGSSTNIYTGFRAWVNDFGLFGFVGLSLLVGVMFTIAYLTITHYRFNKYSCLYKCIYGYFLYGLVYMFATPELTTSLFSVTQLMDFFFIIVAYLLIIHSNDIFKNIRKMLRKEK